jgi:putative membrane protein
MSAEIRHRIGVLAAVATVVLALALASGGAAAHGGDDGRHHHDGTFGMHDGGWWGTGLGWLWMLGGLLALVVIPLVGVLLVGRRDDGSDTALERLRERYATGEIDDDEFRRRRETLED